MVEIGTSSNSDYVRIAILQNVDAVDITVDNWIFS